MVQAEGRENTTINILVPHTEENLLTSWAGIECVKTVCLVSLVNQSFSDYLNLLRNGQNNKL
jgi:hypothetical protein